MARSKFNAKATVVGSSSKSELEVLFSQLLDSIARDIQRPVTQYRFHDTRRWMFDFAWKSQRVAVEIDGGQWMPHGGRHNTDKDREKLNEAAALGWRVLRFSGTMLKSNPGACIDDLRAALRCDHD